MAAMGRVPSGTKRITRQVVSRTVAQVLAYTQMLLRTIFSSTPSYAIAVDAATSQRTLKVFEIRARTFLRRRLRDYHLGTLRVRKEDAQALFGLFSGLMNLLMPQTWHRKLLAFTSDGAPVMRSKENGVAGHVMRKCSPSRVRTLWCMPHEINLVTKTGANGCPISGEGDPLKCPLLPEASLSADDGDALSVSSEESASDDEEEDDVEEDVEAEQAAEPQLGNLAGESGDDEEGSDTEDEGDEEGNTDGQRRRRRKKVRMQPHMATHNPRGRRLTRTVPNTCIVSASVHFLSFHIHTHIR
eukprot:GHVU01141637.1.p1 GENE.GHVU01141637.1~~GHVU01141637.1.p1  ORF type:complete len:300 (+),score=37.43 GHVU01141637.1:3899-4798(+)